MIELSRELVAYAIIGVLVIAAVPTGIVVMRRRAAREAAAARHQDLRALTATPALPPLPSWPDAASI